MRNSAVYRFKGMTALLVSGAAALQLMAPFANAQSITISPTTRIPVWVPFDVISTCPPGYDPANHTQFRPRMIIFKASDPTAHQYRYYQESCGLKSHISIAIPGAWEARMVGVDSQGNTNYNIVYTKTPFEILPIAKSCRDFTTTARYISFKLEGLRIGPKIFTQPELETFNGGAVAYQQLKGNWCYYDGPALNRVNKYRNLRLETAITGSGIGGLVFKIRPGMTGQIFTENYGTGVGDNAANQYRIAGTTSIVSAYSPVEAEIKIKDLGVVKIPAGTTVDLYTLKTDTALTGSGNGSCAGTAYGPCTVELGTPVPFY